MAQIGPQLPPGFKPKRQTESESDKSSSSGSESEDDVFGPKPVAPDQAGTSTAASAAEAIEKRQLAMRKKLEDDQAVKPEAREEWMLELPDEKRGLLGLGPRKFKTKNFTAGGDRSIWTDTPVDRARKAEEAESGPAKPKPMNPEDLAAAARDRKLEKIAAKLKEGRAESLLEMHRRGAEFPDLAKKKDQEEEATKKRKRDSATDSSSSSSSSDTESEGESSKKKRKEKKKRKKEKKKLKKLKKALAKEAAKKEAKKKEKKKKKEGEKPERIPFDRDKDFNIAKIDVSARDSMIKKAGKLNSNFYTGKQKFL